MINDNEKDFLKFYAHHDNGGAACKQKSLSIRSPLRGAMALGNTLEKKHHRMEKRKKIRKIEFAANDRIESVRQYVDKVLEALGHPEALVTNESRVWDFTSDKSDLERVSKKLNLSVDENHYIWELAERYKTRKQR